MTSMTPGWYPHPEGLATLRWWNGADWTEQLAPMQVTTLHSPTRAITSKTTAAGVKYGVVGLIAAVPSVLVIAVFPILLVVLLPAVIIARLRAFTMRTCGACRKDVPFSAQTCPSCHASFVAKSAMLPA